MKTYVYIAGYWLMTCTSICVGVVLFFAFLFFAMCAVDASKELTHEQSDAIGWMSLSVGLVFGTAMTLMKFGENPKKESKDNG